MELANDQLHDTNPKRPKSCAIFSARDVKATILFKQESEFWTSHEDGRKNPRFSVTDETGHDPASVNCAKERGKPEANSNDIATQKGAAR